MAPFTSNYCTRRLQCGAGDREREEGGGIGWWRGKDFCGNLHLKLALSIISPCSPIVYKHFSSSFCLIRMN